MPERRDKYERAVAQALGVERALAFSNGRTALACTLRAAGLRAGDEVLLSPLTCKVVPLTLLSLGLTPVYGDISADTLNLEARAVTPASGGRRRLVLFQHTYGSPAGLPEVRDAAAGASLTLVEDRAQCLPLPRQAAEDARSFASIFSNNLLKPLPTGSGGLAVTSHRDVADELEKAAQSYQEPPASADRALRLSAWVHDHVLRPSLYWPMLRLYAAISPSYHQRPVSTEIATDVTATALRASPLQVARGLAALPTVWTIADGRRRTVAAYAKALTGRPGILVPPVDTTLPLYYFPVRIRAKRRLLDEARRRRVEVIAWPGPTPIYQVEHAERLSAYGYTPGSCPVAETVASELVALPTHSRLRQADVARIVALVERTAA